jgi:hypothetical protein
VLRKPFLSRELWSGKMNGTASRFLRLTGSLAGLVVLGWVLTGQAAKPVRHGIPLPTDWSHRHMIFGQPNSPEQLARISKEPRYWQQLYRREATQTLAVEMAADISDAHFRQHRSQQKRFHRDWSISLGSGATAGAENYPAKFSYDALTANCSSATTPDYVVYGTGLSSSSTQASIVAFDNLYSGCTGTVPTTYWAYNTTGSAPGIVKTSPIASLDGTQVAFVQTDGFGHGTVVLLKWKANDGSIGTPSAPALDTAAQYASCATTPCMVQFNLRDSGGAQTDDQTSSIYYDFTNDIAWVGDNIGLLHQFHPFFLGTPAEVRTSPWPLLVSGASLSSPVYDSGSNNVFIGDASGYLHAVNATTGAETSSGQLDFGTGIIDGPVVDSLNGLVYVFASSDGTALCTAGVACSAVYQLTTTFASLSTGTKVVVGDSLVYPSSTPNPLYLGGFDSAYYKSGNATGNLYVCGNTGAIPTLYQVPISAGSLPVASNKMTPLTSATAPCSPVTDIPNPNTTNGPSERIFVSVQNKGVSTPCSSGGCIFNFVNAPWKASTVYAVGQQILVKQIPSGNLYFETVSSVTPTNATSGTTEPLWGTSPGSTRTDNQVTWINQGTALNLTTSTPAAWQASTSYGTYAKVLDSNGNVEVNTGAAGTSGSAPPTWNAIGLTTSDNTVTWANLGTPATFALPSTGGSSGIISDNVVAPGTLAGASQIYFTTLSDQTCTTSGTTGGCAVQASQPALQ